MKNNTELFNKWNNAAYYEFAHNGPDFSLKALSMKTGLPRATFYYHFINREHLISQLLKFHKETIAAKFNYDLERKVRFLIPDLYELMYKYKTAVCFQQQLLRNNHIKMYYDLYCCVNNSSIQILLPYIKAYFGFTNTDQEIIRFYSILTDAWYSRINTNNLTVKSMCDMAEIIMKNTLSLYKNSIHLKFQ